MFARLVEWDSIVRLRGPSKAMYDGAIIISSVANNLFLGEGVVEEAGNLFRRCIEAKLLPHDGLQKYAIKSPALETSLSKQESFKDKMLLNIAENFAKYNVKEKTVRTLERKMLLE
jgi:hypothetical protein